MVEKEVVMINAVTLALDYKAKYPRCWDDEAVAHVMKTLVAPAEIKLYGIAAATEILKLRASEGFNGLSNKQLVQQFVDNIYGFMAKMHAGGED
jgi:hypothetical protein